MMQKIISLFVACFLAFTAFGVNAAQSHSQNSQHKSIHRPVDLYFFWSTDCPHCIAAHPFIDSLQKEYGWLRVHSYEVSENPRNAEIYHKMASQHGDESGSVPAFFIGDKMIMGYSNAETTGAEIREAVLAKKSKG